mmetsp:Transcript_39333/g.90891  ORF Transcript_39333/g.90891 Transcript_39333/m.90891 type:complete len:237 (+) Transcript_39333:284-994(+)
MPFKAKASITATFDCPCGSHSAGIVMPSGFQYWITPNTCVLMNDVKSGSFPMSDARTEPSRNLWGMHVLMRMSIANAPLFKSAMALFMLRSSSRMALVLSSSCSLLFLFMPACAALLDAAGAWGCSVAMCSTNIFAGPNFIPTFMSSSVVTPKRARPVMCSSRNTLMALPTALFSSCSLPGILPLDHTFFARLAAPSISNSATSVSLISSIFSSVSVLACGSCCNRDVGARTLAFA